MARAKIFGIALSPGIALGRIIFLHPPQSEEKRRIGPEEIAQQCAELERAAQKAREELEQAMLKVPDELAEYRDVIAAQMELARDPKLIGAALESIGCNRITADWALENTVNELCAIFQNMEDPYLRDRAQDIRALGQRMRKNMRPPLPDRPANVSGGQVLTAFDISPADVMELDLTHIAAIVTVEGGATSHSAILARSLRIPALGGLKNLLLEARSDEGAIVDGFEGLLLLGPDSRELDLYARRRREYQAWAEATRQAASQPAITRDGTRIRVMANLDKSPDFACVARNGADGVGLYRTEFSFLKGDLPTEEELYEEYATVARNIFPDPVIFRTLDVGADKMLPIQATLHEANPALGLRGIRFCLRHQGIFQIQLRALLRAGVQGNTSLLLPMICTAGEVAQVRRLIRKISQELEEEGLAHAANPPIGVMIETPAAIMIGPELAAESDFFSIGTNDLIHYLLAIDRSNRHVSYLYDPLHPAVLRSLARIVDTGHQAGIHVSVCGELAADPCGLAVLLGLGVDAVSAAPAFVPGIKQITRQLDAATCRSIADELLNGAGHDARQLVLRRLQGMIGSDLAFYASNLSENRQP